MGEDAKFEASKAWSIWEGSVSRLQVPTREAILKKWGDDEEARKKLQEKRKYFDEIARFYLLFNNQENNNDRDK